jgi:transposase-like protein
VSRPQKPSRQVSVDKQTQVVLAVLKGELSLAEAARRHGVPRRRWATGGTRSETDGNYS